MNGWFQAACTDASSRDRCCPYWLSGGVPPLIDTTYRLPGSGQAHRFSPCDKNSFATASCPVLEWSSFISSLMISAWSALLENKLAIPSIAWRFHVLTCVGWRCRLTEISWTVLSPRSVLRATVALNWTEKLRLFVMSISIHSGEYILARCPVYQITSMHWQTYPFCGGQREPTPLEIILALKLWFWLMIKKTWFHWLSREP